MNTISMYLLVYELEYSVNRPILRIAHYVNRPFMRIGIYVYETLRISICMCIGLYEFTGHHIYEMVDLDDESGSSEDAYTMLCNVSKLKICFSDKSVCSYR